MDTTELKPLSSEYAREAEDVETIEAKRRCGSTSLYTWFAVFAAYMMACLLTLKSWPSMGAVGKLAGKIELVETVPDVMVEGSVARLNRETFESWVDVISKAEESIDIAAYYSTMFCENANGNVCKDNAEKVTNALKDAAVRGVAIRLCIDARGFGDFSDITKYQEMLGDAFTVQYINYSVLIGGVQHAKFLISDTARFYLGSANLDWRALTEVKELGVYVEQPVIAKELQAVFDQFWAMSSTEREVETLPLAENASMQDAISSIYNKLNMSNPAEMDNAHHVFLAQSPPAQLAHTRTHDLKAIIDIINRAAATVYVQAMDYAPLFMYQTPKPLWMELEDALRAAAYRGVTVKIMTQKPDPSAVYPDTEKNNKLWKSLGAIEGVEIYQIQMPNVPNQNAPWDHARLSHSKFVSADGDKCAVSTSNLTGDYFYNTAGLSFIAEGALCAGVHAIMERDLQSSFVQRVYQ